MNSTDGPLQNHPETLPRPLPAAGTTRRDMLKSLGRYGALLGLLGGLGALAQRGGACPSTSCAACASFSRCDWPRAQDARVSAAGKQERS